MQQQRMAKVRLGIRGGGPIMSGRLDTQCVRPTTTPMADLVGAPGFNFLAERGEEEENVTGIFPTQHFSCMLVFSV